MTGPLYLEHLTDRDLALLSRNRDPQELRRDPAGIERALEDADLYRTLFGPDAGEPFLHASPFLAFATLTHRAARDLRSAHFVEEWVGPRQRVPVFEVAALRDFLADPVCRFFLAELLASYTHVASGSVWVQTRRGPRRRRFSELDPLRLIELLDLVPLEDRPAIYRRLGDLALFLTGVFPDYTGERLLIPRERQRLERLVRLDADSGGTMDALWLLEQIGQRSYRMAQRSTNREALMGRALIQVTEHFATARRILNFLTDRYLFPRRTQWFAAS